MNLQQNVVKCNKNINKLKLWQIKLKMLQSSNQLISNSNSILPQNTFQCMIFQPILDNFAKFSQLIDIQPPRQTKTISWAMAYNFNYQSQQLMDIQEVDKQQAIIYLTILVVLEVLLIIFTIASNQQGLIMFSFLRLLLLVGAHCMKNIAWAAYYTIFALIATLYVFDPVGLWIIGHGGMHTKTQNAFALILFLGCGVAVVVGYMYKKALEQELEEDFMGDANPVGYTNPNENIQRNQFLYRASQNARAQQPQSRKFQQFSGQGYSLN